jgi:glycosyltransferase involved in cell wall biosynthesis
MNTPLISIICPLRNERNGIPELLDFVIKALPLEKEIIMVDGCSTDGTREIIETFIEKQPEVILLENADKIVPHALNLGIKVAKGKYIVRLDAHTEYAADYFLKIIDTFENTGAEIVGGPMRAVGESAFQRAVAVCTSTSFGIGDSKFHHENYKGYADSVYLGAWRKEIFETTGMFDEQLKRNQDDEFHYRSRSLGIKIFLNPEIKAWYYPRGTVKLLSKQYFQYGLFKPLVLKKVKSEIKIRHLVPPVFVLYLIATLIIILDTYNHSDYIYSTISIPFITYILLNLYFSIKSQKLFTDIPSSLLVYPLLHLSYGVGFILGLFKRNK